jgi:hypothetical protein
LEIDPYPPIKRTQSPSPYAIETERVHQGEEYMAQIAAERIVEHLARSRFVVMQKPPLGGHSAIDKGFDD